MRKINALFLAALTALLTACAPSMTGQGKGEGLSAGSGGIPSAMVNETMNKQEQEFKVAFQEQETALFHREQDHLFILFPSDFFFEENSANLKPEADAHIRRAAGPLKSTPGTLVTISVHTDSVGSEVYNQTLSNQRATAIQKALVSQGVDARRITSVRGYGESAPISSNATDAGRARNRRIILEIIPNRI